MRHEAVEVDLQLCYASPKARGIDAKSVNALADSISEFGLLQPITVRRVEKSRAGQMSAAFEVIAGMHRVKAFRKLGRATIPAFVQDMDDLHAELALIDENLCRNDLTPAERASAQARRKAIYQQLHPETKRGAAGGAATKANSGQAVGQVGQEPTPPRFDEAAADATGQSERSIRRDVTRGEVLGEDALAKVARTSLDKGEELDALAKLSPEVRDSLILRAASGEVVSAKTEAKQQIRANKEALLGAKQALLPNKRFGVIVADPEWRFEPWSRDTGLDRSADNHYPTSCLDVIKERDVPSIAADDCVLFLWATAPMLPHALLVMAAWGFDYVSNYVWDKVKVGTGYWNRNVHEHLLIGTRGKPPAPAMGTQFNSIIESKATRHSAKPEAFLEMIETYYPTLPKIELNRRGPARKGWAAWGNEALPGEFDETTGEVLPDSAPSACNRENAPPPATPETMPESIPLNCLDPEVEDIPQFLRRPFPVVSPASESPLASVGEGKSG